MLDFEVKSKVQPVGERKGQTVYFCVSVPLKMMDTGLRKSR